MSQPRHATTSFRLPESTRIQLDQLRRLILDPHGEPVTSTDVVRIAIAELHASRCGNGAKEIPKKSGKKA